MKPVRVTHSFACVVGFINTVAQMIIMARESVANKTHGASSKVNVIIHSLTLFTSYNESLVSSS